MITRKSVVSSPLVMLYELSYTYRNYVVTVSCDNPEINHKMILSYFVNHAPASLVSGETFKI